MSLLEKVEVLDKFDGELSISAVRCHHMPLWCKQTGELFHQEE